MEKQLSLSAVFPVILKEENEKTFILLARRFNTGYMDGKWDIAGSGHVDKGETAKMAVVRECKEELGISVKLEDVSFIHLSHVLLPDRVYYDLDFKVEKYTGIPSIMEPEKCSELGWFDLNDLPDDLVERRKTSINDYLKGNYYAEP